MGKKKVAKERTDGVKFQVKDIQKSSYHTVSNDTIREEKQQAKLDNTLSVATLSKHFKTKRGEWYRIFTENEGCCLIKKIKGITKASTGNWIVSEISGVIKIKGMTVSGFTVRMSQSLKQENRTIVLTDCKLPIDSKNVKLRKILLEIATTLGCSKIVSGEVEIVVDYGKQYNSTTTLKTDDEDYNWTIKDKRGNKGFGVWQELTKDVRLDRMSLAVALR